jgi:hypothetical protein
VVYVKVTILAFAWRYWRDGNPVRDSNNTNLDRPALASGCECIRDFSY